MSDQVIFTKEEVEKIRRIISSTMDGLCIDCKGCSNDVDRKCLERSRLITLLALLDSSRPRPKVNRHMLHLIHEANEMSEHVWNARAEAIADNYGFDVED
jgi:hypothetical protein